MAGINEASAKEQFDVLGGRLEILVAVLAGSMEFIMMFTCRHNARILHYIARNSFRPSCVERLKLNLLSVRCGFAAQSSRENRDHHL